jgi:hypothetical protein
MAYLSPFRISLKFKPIIKSFSGVQGAVFQKSPLEIVKCTKRVRSVGWAGLKVNKVLFFLPIRWPKKIRASLYPQDAAPVRYIVLKGTKNNR